MAATIVDWVQDGVAGGTLEIMTNEPGHIYMIGVAQALSRALPSSVSGGLSVVPAGVEPGPQDFGLRVLPLDTPPEEGGPSAVEMHDRHWQVLSSEDLAGMRDADLRTRAGPFQLEALNGEANDRASRLGYGVNGDDNTPNDGSMPGYISSINGDYVAADAPNIPNGIDDITGPPEPDPNDPVQPPSDAPVTDGGDDGGDSDNDRPIEPPVEEGP
ncbi:hypothetical protein [Caulobacter segnis]